MVRYNAIRIDFRVYFVVFHKNVMWIGGCWCLPCVLVYSEYVYAYARVRARCQQTTLYVEYVDRRTTESNEKKTCLEFNLTVYVPFVASPSIFEMKEEEKNLNTTEER